jgi:hypothetical protein
MRMIVHPHAVEARVLTPGDEVGHAENRGSNRNAKVNLHAKRLPSDMTWAEFGCNATASSL